MHASPPRLREATRPARRAGGAFREAAVREVTRLHEARESPWWVEAVGVPVQVAGGFEAVDVVLRSAGAAMALQCLQMTPLPTLRFERRAARTAAGNLFTAAHEVRQTARGDTQLRECPALYDAAIRALRGAAGLTNPQVGPGGISSSPRRPTPAAVPAVLTMARLVPERHRPAPDAKHRDEMGRDAAAERFWVWLLTGAPAVPPRQAERRPVAVVTWLGLRHFLSVAAREHWASSSDL